MVSNYNRMKAALITYWKSIAIVLTTIALTSCLPDPLDVRDIPKAETQIVVSSQLIPGESLVVFISKTIGALDASDNDDELDVLNLIAVNDATVTIEGSFGVETLSFLGYGFYGGVDLEFIEGEEYRLVVRSESLGEVEATTKAFPAVSFESIELEKYFNGFDDTLAQVTYTLKDPGVENNYIITVQPISLDDPPIYERVLNPDVYTRLVSDEDFDGSELIGETFTTVWQDYEKGDTVMVTLANVSEDYANFIQLRLDNRVGLIEFASEPINYPSNVVGGRGFFNLYKPDIRFFVLD